MPRVARVKSRSGIYHIMWRGASGQEIFHDDDDRMNFLEIIRKVKRRFHLKIYAWCLMSNHVHFLIKEGNEPVSDTMKRIGVSVVKVYNFKYRTTGHLFQDRFKSEKVETDQYLLTVVRYIHQNPVKAGMVTRVDEWKWSSCLAYYKDPSAAFPDLIDQSFVLSRFANDLVRFKGFNERANDDQCLDLTSAMCRLTDDEGRAVIVELLGTGVNIAQVKSLPKLERDPILRKVKQIEGLSQRQAAIILGVSASLIFKA
ncbi:REP-associated tyrosine transposase [Alteribacter aurantiacus]|uniref:REP-associated tyrosine transposase n=1 Tax=Alteribacter aurantiacus TaxID=254410 RepID=UPI000420E9EE|nr:transposase [Alteribacter aurantiacus]